jgi:hypothetical protein
MVSSGDHSENIAAEIPKILTLPIVEQTCSNSGADVCHVDANKVSLNLKEIGLDENVLPPIPHVTCNQFVQDLAISTERCKDLSFETDDLKRPTPVHSPSSETSNLMASMDLPSQDAVAIN